MFESPKVGLPEYMRGETIEGILPGTFAFFPPSLLTYDRFTDSLWLNQATPVRPENVTLTAFYKDKHNHIALMPLLNDTGEIDYIIDASGIEAGEMTVVDDLLGYREEQTRFIVSDDMERRRAIFRAISAAAFTNRDGQIEFHGHASHFESLAYLVTAYEEYVAHNTFDGHV